MYQETVSMIQEVTVTVYDDKDCPEYIKSSVCRVRDAIIASDNLTNKMKKKILLTDEESTLICTLCSLACPPPPPPPPPNKTCSMIGVIWLKNHQDVDEVMIVFPNPIENQLASENA